jgi:LemA protein
MLTALIFGSIAVIFLVITFLTYNNIVRARNRVANALAQTDVLLKRRLDLIPNLVEVVRGYAGHERSTLESVVLARSSALTSSSPSEINESNREITLTLSRLLALREAYPEMKADSSFTRLQDELSSTENQISFSRQSYNDAVTRFNDLIETFPSLIVARLGGFPRAALLEKPEGVDNPPSVRF